MLFFVESMKIVKEHLCIMMNKARRETEAQEIRRVDWVKEEVLC